jgi:hypothetical protein
MNAIYVTVDTPVLGKRVQDRRFSLEKDPVRRVILVFARLWDPKRPFASLPARSRRMTGPPRFELGLQFFPLLSPCSVSLTPTPFLFQFARPRPLVGRSCLDPKHCSRSSSSRQGHPVCRGQHMSCLDLVPPSFLTLSLRLDRTPFSASS